MKREPTAEEREKIDRAITDGDRIEATSMYISITECGLADAPSSFKRSIPKSWQRNTIREISFNLCSQTPLVFAFPMYQLAYVFLST